VSSTPAANSGGDDNYNYRKEDNTLPFTSLPSSGPSTHPPSDKFFPALDQSEAKRSEDPPEKISVPVGYDEDIGVLVSQLNLKASHLKNRETRPTCQAVSLANAFSLLFTK